MNATQFDDDRARVLAQHWAANRQAAIEALAGCDAEPATERELFDWAFQGGGGPGPDDGEALLVWARQLMESEHETAKRMVEGEGSNGNPEGALVYLVECETGLDSTSAWRLCELACRSEGCRMCEDLGERNGEPCSCLAGSMVALGREVDTAIEAEDNERRIEAIVNAYGEPLPVDLRDVDPKHLDGHGEPHPDHPTEIKILRWALGYRTNEPDPWTAKVSD